MELTPRLLHDVEFSQEWRGYNREEVDDFLERVAASVDQLLTRLRDTGERSAVASAPEPAEAPAPEAAAAAAPVDDTETITRTLVLAQRTADAAIAEANERAAAIVAEAQQRAEAVLAAAEADARRILDSGRAEAAGEAKQLEETRGLLQADVEALEQHLAAQRHAVEAVIGRLQSMIDDPDALRAGERPELHVTPAISPVEPTAAPPAAPRASSSSSSASEAPPADVAEALEVPVADAAGIELEAAATPGFDEPDDFDDRGGPPTMEVAAVFIDDDDDAIDLSRDGLAGATGDDAFLTELRKAATDDAPLGPRDDLLMPAGGVLFDQDDVDARDGLRSRLRRRP